MGSNLVRRTGALTAARTIFGLFLDVQQVDFDQPGLIEPDLGVGVPDGCNEFQREGVPQCSFRNQLVCNFVARCFQRGSEPGSNVCLRDMAPSDFVNQDRRADGVVSLPEIFPKVCVGWMFPPSSLAEPLTTNMQSFQITNCCVALTRNRRPRHSRIDGSGDPWFPFLHSRL